MVHTLSVLILFASFSISSFAAQLPAGLTSTCPGMGSDRDGVASSLASPPRANPTFRTPEACASAIRQTSEGCFANQDTNDRERERIVTEAAATPRAGLGTYERAQQTAFNGLNERYSNQARTCQQGQGRSREACSAEKKKLEAELKLQQEAVQTASTQRTQRQEELRLAAVANDQARIAELRPQVEQLTQQHKAALDRTLQLHKDQLSLQSVMDTSDSAFNNAAACNAGQARIFANSSEEMQQRLDQIAAGPDSLTPTGAAPITPQTVAEQIAEQARKLAGHAPSAAVKSVGGALESVAPIAGVATKLVGGGIDPDPGNRAVSTVATALEATGRVLAPRLPILGTGPGALFYGVAGNSTAVSRCSEIFYDPYLAYNAGRCSVFSPQGAYANEQAISNLSAK